MRRAGEIPPVFLTFFEARRETPRTASCQLRADSCELPAQGIGTMGVIESAETLALESNREQRPASLELIAPSCQLAAPER